MPILWVLHLLGELEAERHIQRIVCWLHHSWHHHSWVLHGLRHLWHSWMSHSHHLLMYILHNHLRACRQSHEIWLPSLATHRRHHHLGVLWGTPNSWMTHSGSCGSCHLLLLHHVNLHWISSIRPLSHIPGMIPCHLHWRRWHHRWCLMRHRRLLLS